MRIVHVLHGVLASAVFALGLSVGVSAPAEAATVNGGTLTPGVAVAAVVTAPGQHVQYQFAGVSGQHVTFDVSASAWASGSTPGTAYFHLYSPAGVYSGFIYLAQGSTYKDFTLNASGTWRLVLDPTGSAVGHVSFTLAGDVADRGLNPGVAVNTTIGYRGQNAGYYFVGASGQHVSVDVSASAWASGSTPGSAYLRLYSPAGVYSGFIYLAQGPAHGDFTLSASGTWRLTLDPTAAATGHITVTLTHP
jgi:hypothetical protein